jgi:predicted RecB family nuclease
MSRLTREDARDSLAAGVPDRGAGEWFKALKSFSASTVKSWFQYRCERKVRYELSSDAELAAVPVLKDVREAPWAKLGNEYENRVVRRLAAEGGLLQPAAGETVLSERLTLAFLRGDRPETYAAQVNLKPTRTPKFLEGSGLDLNRNIADLVRRTVLPDGRVQFTVIDIKATRRATAFHKAQIAFYVRVLEERLAEIGLRTPAVLDREGEVWRIPDDGAAEGDRWQAEVFGLRPYLRQVDDFCAHHLPGIAQKRIGASGFDQTFFHLYFKCEQCAFLEHCGQAITPELGAARDVSAVPGVTHESKRALNRMGVNTVGALSKARGLAKAPGVGWSLARHAPRLTLRAQALAEGRVLRTEEEHSFLMPPRADARLFLSLDYDPVDDRIAALGYRRVDVGEGVSQAIRVPANASATEEADALVAVMGALIADLTAIDQANRERADAGDDTGLRFAHIFFYEPSEALNLQKAVGRHLDDPRVRGGLLHLVRLFPPDDVVPEPEFKGAHHLPATAVRSVVEQLYALPVAVAYDLRQVSQALGAVGAASPYHPAKGFERPFSSLLSIDVVRGFREDAAGAPRASDIEQDVAARLDALQGVTGWLYQQHQVAGEAGAPLLRLNKRPFRFHETFNPLDASDLDVLLACELLENRAGLLDTLVGLAQPASRRRDAGRCMAGLELLRAGRYTAHQQILVFRAPPESQDSDLGPGDFKLILTDDAPDLRLNPTAWPLVECQIKRPDDDDLAQPHIVKVIMRRALFEGPVFQELLRTTPPNGWHLDRPFFDANTDKAARFLSHLAARQAA